MQTVYADGISTALLAAVAFTKNGSDRHESRY